MDGQQHMHVFLRYKFRVKLISRCGSIKQGFACDRMENWLSIEELERESRNSFLIHRQPTEIDIYRLKELFRQIEEAIATIETLVRELKTPGPKSSPKYRIEEEAVRLLFASESLNEMTGDNKALKEQFILGLVKIKSRVDMILERIINLLSDRNKSCP